MSIQFQFNGTTYAIPTTGENDWGNQVTNFLVDVGTNVNIQKEQIQAARTVTGDSTISTSDFGIYVNGTAPVNITLPSAPIGTIYAIRDVSANAKINNITITPAMGQTIDGLPTRVINSNNGGTIIQFAGSNTWRVINESFGVESAISSLTVGGQASVGYLQVLNVATFSTDGTIDPTSAIVRIWHSSAPCTLTLPASFAVGSLMTIKDVDGSLNNGAVTLLCQGSDLLDGQTSYVMRQARSSVTLSKTGTSEWSIL